MKRNILMLVTVFAIMGAFALNDHMTAKAQDATIQAQKWEYHSVQFSTHQTAAKKHLAALGESGWELVTIVDIGTTLQGTYFFKRPK